MSKKEQVEQMTRYMANFVSYGGKKLPDDVEKKLGELAEREHISRQGARDVIVRAEQQLRDMERQLGLIRRHMRLSAQLDRLSDLARALPKDTAQRQPLLEGLDEAYRILEDDDGV